jgi:hypothetical protein
MECEEIMKMKMTTNQFPRECEPNMIRDSAASLCTRANRRSTMPTTKRIDGTRKRDSVGGRFPETNVSRLRCPAQKPGSLKLPSE